MQNILINIGLYLTYFMLFVAALSALVFPIIFIIQDPGKAKASLFGVLALLLLFVISYFLSADELHGELLQSHVVSKFVGGGLIMFYIMFVAAILIAVYSEVSRIFK